MAKENELLIEVEGGDETKKPYLALDVMYIKGRGYFLGVTPINLEQTRTPGLTVRSFMLYSGSRTLIEAATRLNRKRQAALFEKAVSDFRAKQGPAYALVEAVAQKNGLKLKGP